MSEGGKLMYCFGDSLTYGYCGHLGSTVHPFSQKLNELLGNEWKYNYISISFDGYFKIILESSMMEWWEKRQNR